MRTVLAIMLASVAPLMAAGAQLERTPLDTTVKADIQRTLDEDTTLDDSHIFVKSVDGGDVILDGTATSVADIIQALKLTASRPGVRRVFSHIEGDPRLRFACGADT